MTLADQPLTIGRRRSLAAVLAEQLALRRSKRRRGLGRAAV
ncbi:hypothetical protein [Leisingera sp. NJS201]|nr:hypothetical protein [Leisingera sp. NJS201]